MKHGSETYDIVGEGRVGEALGGRELALTTTTAAPAFRFSRLGPKGTGLQLGDPARKALGNLMVAGGGRGSSVPSGFTFLRQVIHHHLTFDKTNVALGVNVPATQLLQARSPSLDLDSMYGAGPADPESAKFYEADGLHLKVGKTLAAGGFPAMDGFDLLRGEGTTVEEKRTAIIPDPRNDENLAVAQTHLALIRFHNRVVDTLPASVPQPQRFARARELVTKHYQWMIRSDFLPRICGRGTLSDVFTGGRK